MTGQALVTTLSDFFRLILYSLTRMHANKPSKMHLTFVILICLVIKCIQVHCTLLHKSHSYLLVSESVDTHA